MKTARLFTFKGALTQQQLHYKIFTEKNGFTLSIDLEGKKKEFKNSCLWDAVIDCRLFLEDKGLIPEWNASAINAVMSGMQRSYGGREAYLVKVGMQADIDKQVDIMSANPNITLSTIKDQNDFSDHWYDSLGKNHEKT